MSDSGVNVKLLAKDRVGGCTGYFEWPTLCVATDREGWQEVFLHEYCHFKQTLDENRGKAVAYPLLRDASYLKWAAWLSGKVDVSPRTARRLRRGIQLMERDCDRRAIATARHFELPIDIGAYTRHANAYHLFYTVAERHRSWYRTPPYEVPELLGMVPGNRLCRDYEHLPSGFEETVVAKCLR